MPSISPRLHFKDVVEDRLPLLRLEPWNCLALIGVRPDGMFHVLTYHADDLPESRSEMHEAMAGIREVLTTKEWGDWKFPGVEQCTSWTPFVAPQFDCAAFDTFKWDVIASRLEAEEAQEDDDNPDHLLKSLYLGSILNIVPSGQYRAPWSGAKACPLCDGQGSAANVLHDVHYLAAVQKQRSEITVRNRDLGLMHDQWPQADQVRCRQLDFELQSTGPTLTCPFCGGDGSRIRVEDSDFMEYLEGKADEFSAFITGSDGDGCDVLIQKVVPKPDEEEEDDGSSDDDDEAPEAGAPS